MNYKKVVVFTPMEILESMEVETNRLHEDILGDMFDEHTWASFDEMKETQENSHSILFYGAPVSRATYLSYQVGFSVLYETESSTVLFISDYITDEMMLYLKEKLGVPENKILAFETFMEDAQGVIRRYQKEPSFSGFLIDDYECVFEDLMNVLEQKKNQGRKR